MCGRFTLTTSPEQLRAVFEGFSVPDQIQPRYNIAPTQPIAVVPNDGKNQVDFFLWGLIPAWAKEPTISSRMINARAETLAERPAYRAAYRRRRCLVLADGFYEWRLEPGGRVKTPMYIKLQSGQPFAFAGLWENWQSPNGSNVFSCAIITTEPNNLMQAIHNRMPVILPASAFAQWLEPRECNPQQLEDLLVPFPPEQMQAFAVSTLVNSPANDNPRCIQPVN